MADLGIDVNVDAAGTVTIDGDFDALENGEDAVVNLTYLVRDNSGDADTEESVTAAVQFTITGTNDQPVLETTLITQAETEAEDTQSFTYDLNSFTDEDANDTHTYEQVGAETVTLADGTNVTLADLGIDVNVDAAGTVTIDGDFDALENGEDAVVNLTYLVRDNSGDADTEESVTAAVQFTITGTNDQPVLETTLITQAETEAEDAQSFTYDLNNFTDEDANDTHTYEQVGAETVTLADGTNVTLADLGIDVNVDAAGTVTIDGDFDALENGEDAVVNLTYLVRDNSGDADTEESVTAAVQFTITGTNDQPVLETTLITQAETEAEDAQSFTYDLNNFTDEDANDTHTYEQVGAETVTLADGTNVTLADLGIDVNVDAAGTVTIDGDFDALENGEDAVVNLTYLVRDNSGDADTEESVTAAVQFTITGTNDQPVLETTLITQAETEAEDAQSFTYDLNNFTDEDANDTHTYEQVGAETVTLADGTNVTLADLGIDVNVDAAGTVTIDGDFDALENGEDAVVNLTYLVRDNSGDADTEESVTAAVQFTITGTNDQPVLETTLITQAETEAEDAQSFTYDLNNFTDEDANDTHTYEQVGAETVTLADGTNVTLADLGIDVNVDAAGTVTIDGDFDALENGEDAVVNLTYLVRDNSGDADTEESVTAAVQFTITGTNDQPVLETTLITQAETEAEDAQSFTYDLNNFTDEDANDTHTYEQVGAETVTLADGTNVTLADLGIDVNVDAAGTVTIDGDFDALENGEDAVVNLTYLVRDNSGDADTEESVTAAVQFTITGTNDQPVLETTLITQAETEAEDAQSFTYDLNNFTDEDANDTHTYEQVGAETVTLADGTNVTLADLGIDVNVDAAGTVTIDGDFDALENGEDAVVNLTYLVRDNSGDADTEESVTAAVQFTITGTNDQPVLETTLITQAETEAEDAQSFTYDLNNFTDEDANDTHTYEQVGAETVTLADGTNVTLADLGIDVNVDAAGTVTIDGDFDALENGEDAVVNLTYLVRDNSGDADTEESVTAAVQFTITGTNDQPVLETTLITQAETEAEDAQSFTYDLNNFTDEDANDTHTYEQVGAETVTLADGTNVTLADLGIDVNVDAAGTVTIDGDFDALENGEDAVVNLTYLVRDNSGDADTEESVTAAVQFTITGTNDQPVLETTLITQAETEAEDAQSFTYDLNNFTDEDANDTHTYEQVGAETVTLADGTNVTLADLGIDVNVDAAGTVTIDGDFDALENGEDAVVNLTYLVRDNSGDADTEESVTAAVQFTITGTNDQPVLETTLITQAETEAEDAQSFTYDLNNFTDEDANDTHTYEQVGAETVTLADGTNVTLADLGIDVNVDAAGTVTIDGDFDALENGEDAVVNLTYLVRDNSGDADTEESVTAAVQFTITGTNDEPVLETTLITQAETEAEDAQSFTYDLNNFTDEDANDTHTYEQVGAETVTLADGTNVTLADLGIDVNVDAAGTVTIDGDFDALENGEDAVVNLTYLVRDNSGDADTEESVTAAVQFTITGTNDQPVLETTLITQAETEAEDAQSFTYDLNNFTDEDANDTHTYEQVGAETVTLADGTNVTLADLGIDVNVDAAGTVTIDGDFDALENGEDAVVNLTYLVRDNSGDADTEESVTAAVQFTITGTNDQPTISAYIEETNVEENILTGAISVTDVATTDIDTNDTHHFVALRRCSNNSDRYGQWLTSVRSQSLWMQTVTTH